MKKQMRSCLTCGVLCMLIPGCFTLYFFGTMYSTSHPERGEHQPQSAFGGGPPEATDFCWYRSYFFTAYEFSCTEEQFRKWAAKYPLAEIKEAKPFQLMRYNYPDTKPPLSVENEEEYKEYEVYKKTVNATICHGLYATQRASNGGGYDVAYDRETQRGYFFTCPR